MNDLNNSNQLNYSDSNPELKKPILAKLLQKSFHWFCYTLFKLYCPLKTKGLENLPSSSFILCSNHCSHMDSVILIVSSQLPFSKFAMVAAKDYFFDNSKSRFFTYILNLIPIHRKTTPNTLAENIQSCKDALLNKNRNLIIYPEGTRSLSGEMRSFKRGPAMIAAELNIPLVPAHIQGAYEAMPKGRFFPIPKRISVVIGNPIYPAHYQTETTNQKRNLTLYSQLTEKLSESILQLKEQHHVLSK